MAVIFGSRSLFLATKRLKMALWIVVAVAVFAAGFYTLIEVVGLSAGTAGIFGAAFIIMIMKAASEVLGIFRRRYGQVDRGMAGEERAMSALAALPAGFAVFRGLQIGPRQDIDAAVVGPSGVFAVEVKSHKGHVAFDGNGLTRDGRYFEKDFLSETTREASGLRRLIRHDAGEDAYVGAILAFTRADVPFVGQSVRGVAIADMPWLPGTITHGPDSRPLSPARVLKIARALARRSGDPRAASKLAQLEKELMG